MEKQKLRKMITEDTGPIPDSKLWEYEGYVDMMASVFIDYVFDSDGVETERSALDPAKEEELYSDTIDFLFADSARVYKALKAKPLTAQEAGTRFAAIRSSHGGYLLDDRTTEAARVYGDPGIY